MQIRYLTLATAIVVGIAAVIGGWAARDAIRLRIAPATVSAAPKAGPSNAPGGQPSVALRGDAPWALSALPECFTQLSHVAGTPAYVRAHLPSDAVQLRPPASVRVADCTVVVQPGEAIEVRRGNDALRVPPPAWLYRVDDRFVLLRAARGGNDLRIYEPTVHAP